MKIIAVLFKVKESETKKIFFLRLFVFSTPHIINDSLFDKVLMTLEKKLYIIKSFENLPI